MPVGESMIIPATDAPRLRLPLPALSKPPDALRQSLAEVDTHKPGGKFKLLGGGFAVPVRPPPARRSTVQAAALRALST